ncbi:MAG: hypothetical protein Q8O56_14055 [Solirubrobacteraceae bacterium]|nr:hypothetical protein [Solirubrobacteraceae bacterium]
MRRFGEVAMRVFKSLAGIERDQPASAFVIAFYGMLFLVAMSLVVAWVTGTPLECAAGGVC